MMILHIFLNIDLFETLKRINFFTSDIEITIKNTNEHLNMRILYSKLLPQIKNKNLMTIFRSVWSYLNEINQNCCIDIRQLIK